ncbi:MAG: Gfo/Idh/MocA family oxidoreductase [Verrucomicrobiaceae bacterium]|nr:MAG: Gfo/Idh/MocA family oxidoreductase [Verrucomicrobiaceae bacterium]
METHPPESPLRWGILSTARIIRRNWPSMLGSGSARLVGIASREPGKAERFIAEMQETHPWPEAPRAFGSYEELLERPDIDAVYVPLPTGIRKEWVIRAAETGKHVLCEKPCAVSTEDLLEMTEACARHGVLFMDGVMFMHDPRYVSLGRILDDGLTVGQVKRITSAFSFRGDDGFAGKDIRSQAAMEPAGCLGDLGWYCLRASLWAVRWELPRRVYGRVLESSGDAIMEFSGELEFAEGASAAFHCSFLSPDQQWLNISGTKGNLRVADFVLPVLENDTDWENGWQRVPRGPEEMSSASRMFARFADEVRKEKPDTRWAKISLKTQQVQDACLQSARLGRAVVLRQTDDVRVSYD